jgi:hypothetical protein
MEHIPDPYAFDPAIADYIVANVAGGCSLQLICSKDGVPDRATVARWLASYPEFKASYLAAREAAMEIIADDLLVWTRIGLDQDLACLARAPTLSQLTEAHRTRIAVQQWLMAKWAPKLWGGRIAASEARDDAAESAPHAPSERDPAAPPRLSPRPFLIPPIANGKPITIPGLAMPEMAGEPDFDLDEPNDDEAAADLGPPPRLSRRDRRAMAAMARKRRAHPSAIRSAPDCNPPPI